MGEVCKLPNAATRKVRNNLTPARAFRKEHPWPGVYKAPPFPEKPERYKTVKRTAELCIILAMLDRMGAGELCHIHDTVMKIHKMWPTESTSDAMHLTQDVLEQKLRKPKTET